MKRTAIAVCVVGSVFAVVARAPTAANAEPKTPTIDTKIEALHAPERKEIVMPDMEKTWNEANTFKLKGDGISVAYNSTSISGEPILSYEDTKAASSQEFRGKQIRQLDSEIGMQVTVTLAENRTSKVTLTILISKIQIPNLPRAGKKPFSTAAIITTTGSVPPDESGLPMKTLRNYRVVLLNGTAELVYY